MGIRTTLQQLPRALTSILAAGRRAKTRGAALGRPPAGGGATAAALDHGRRSAGRRSAGASVGAAIGGRRSTAPLPFGRRRLPPPPEHAAMDPKVCEGERGRALPAPPLGRARAAADAARPDTPRRARHPPRARVAPRCRHRRAGRGGGKSGAGGARAGMAVAALARAPPPRRPPAAFPPAHAPHDPPLPPPSCARRRTTTPRTGPRTPERPCGTTTTRPPSARAVRRRGAVGGGGRVAGGWWGSRRARRPMPAPTLRLPPSLPGPILLEDYHLVEKLANVRKGEREEERRRGRGARHAADPALPTV